MGNVFHSEDDLKKKVEQEQLFEKEKKQIIKEALEKGEKALEDKALQEEKGGES